ncbi:MAG TPA: MFS transporter [Steroidobacteraceae bacterium]|jgi:benzoate transport|nr:MFS transporter [Steroidobacteraceae bacterium]
MSRLQIVVVAITIGLNALDGFDVLSISFASPGIAREWRIDRAALGFVLSMELIGMGLGSILLGGVADQFGRRRTLLGCLLVMTLGMFMATQATGVYELSAWRVFTGLGIGGMLATINAVAAEFSNSRRLGLNVSLMAIGYPIGAVVGGSIAALLLKRGDWRVVFQLGAAATALFVPLVFWLVPESISWLCQRQPPGALAGVNRSLIRMGHPPVAELPLIPVAVRKRSVAEIFDPQWLRVTVLVTLAYFLHVTTFYFVVKWVPKIVVDMGFSPASAAGVLVWANVGGATGGAVLGLVSLRLGLKPLTMFVLVMSTVMVAVFGRGQTTLAQLSLVCAVTGFFTNGGIVGIYGILAKAYPTQLRATGTGFAVGVGRAGAMLAPIVAGYLFRAGYSLEFVATAMGSGSLVAALALWLLPLDKSRGLDTATNS